MAKFFLLNPGFELGDRDWTKETGWAISKDVPTARSGSWRSVFTGSANASLVSADFPVRPGNKISFSAWFDGFVATAGEGLTIISWKDKDGIQLAGNVTGNVIAFGQSGYLQSIITNGVAVDRAKSMFVQIHIRNSPNGTTWLADDGLLTGEIIEDIPATAKIASHRMVPADTIGVFDPLVGQDKFTEFNAGMSDKWSGVYSFIPALGADLGELVSFIRRLGRTERLFCFDPDRTVPLNGIVNDMTVDGPITNGTNKIPVKAGPVSSTALKASDYVEIGSQYFQLQRDLEVGPEGTGEMIVWPSVRSTLADGEDLVTDNPKLVARITSDLDWRRIEARPTEISFSWEEI